jgi:hypothetical protein
LIGKSRFGKTTLLEHLIGDDLQQGTGMIVLDAHGDLTNRIVELAPPPSLDRITIVELGVDTAFGLNLYECPTQDSLTVDRVVGNTIEIFKKLFLDERNFYPVIEEGLRNSAYVVIANGHTLHEVPLLFTDRAFLVRSLRAVTNRTVRGFWEEYQQLPARERRELSWPVLNKVNRFLTSDAIRYMIAQSDTTIPFDAVLEGGETLIFRLSGDQLDRETASFLGMVFLASLSNAVATRASQLREDRRRVHVYLDEYGRFATRTTDRMLEEFGKYGIGLTVAHQNLEQLGGKSASAASLVMFQLDGHDAPKMAQHLDTTPRRTKKVMRMRTRAEYKEWTEDVWDSEENEREHERLNKLIEEQREKVGMWHGRLGRLQKMLETDFHEEIRRCGMDGEIRVPQHGSPLGSYYEVAVKGEAPIARRELHMLFNPMPIYFDYVMRHGKADTQSLTRSGSLGLYRLAKDHLGKRYDHGEDDIYEAYYLLPEAASWSWLVRRLREWHKARGFRWGDEAAIDEWAVALGDELADLLVKIYEQRMFFLRVGGHGWRVEELFPIPSEGAERPASSGWSQHYWATSLFPEASEWLAGKIRQFVVLRDDASDQAERLKKRALELHKEHTHKVEHRELQGHKPVKETTQRGVREFYDRSGRREVPILRDEGVYDEIEELDQTHADRAAEIATELASLPKYVAYCKLLDPNGNPHEYRIATRPPAEPVGLMSTFAVVERSRATYGRPWQVVQREIDERVNSEDEDPAPIIGRRT